ncbi:hypothetical protein [Spirosoma fluviale]|uniref:SGNH/GDSL hydrolase family protein n=1 Tax=Spirosoma fluviale TaxID=1597977 RepID=A0A286G0C0_9BACT|nr:hypothetical protein [Spirosoma fluviale]SOD88706.1 hypothetical protein SAMN06269250_2802 [Spirosoma fluviale]
MKAFLTELTLFVLFALAFYAVGLLAFPSFLKRNVHQSGNSHFYFTLKEAKLTQGIDLLFLGSSHTYRSFDPRIFKSAGISSINLGSSAQTPMQTQILVNRYLTQLNPKKVIFEVNPLIFSLDGVESAMELTANDTITPSIVFMVAGLFNLKAYNTLFNSWLRQAFHLNSVQKPYRGVNTYIKGGFVERKMSYFHHKTYNSQRWLIKKEQVKYFTETLAYIQNKGVSVVLVQAPITRDLYNSYKNNLEFDNLMRSTRLPYYNFNNIIFLDDSLHFYDGHHLNQKGVELFNRKLIEMSNGSILLR